MMTLYIILTLINAGLVYLSYRFMTKAKKSGIDPELHSLPEYTRGGEGVIIRNKDQKPVVEFQKALQ